MDEHAHTARDSGAAGGTWRPVDVVIGLVIAFLVVNFGGGFLLVATGDGIAFRLGTQALLAVTLVAVAGGYAITAAGKGEALSALGFRRPRSGWMKLTIGTLVVFFIFAAVFSTLVPPPEQVDVAEELGVDVSVLGAIAAGFLIVVAAPLAEEIFFRGFFFGGLRTAMPFLPAALISGVLFGAIHLTGGNLSAGALLSVLGVMLAWLYERTGSIWSPITLHAINNAFAFGVLVTT